VALFSDPENDEESLQVANLHEFGGKPIGAVFDSRFRTLILLCDKGGIFLVSHTEIIHFL